MIPSTQKFKFIDLFAGIGGFHHALSALGGECVLACELDPEAKKVYLDSFARHGADFDFVDNIRTLTRSDVEDEDKLLAPHEIASKVPDHDVLCGGFPCQPFSKSGEQKGVRDKTRGTLFFDIVQIAEAKKPKFLFLENVRNLAGPRHKDTWDTIVKTLDSIGYRLSSYPLIFSPHLLPYHLGGAPQVRERVFILAVRKDVERGQLLDIANFNDYLLKKRFWNPDAWNIADYLDSDASINNVRTYEVNKSDEMYIEAWNYFVENIPVDSLPGFPIWASAFSEEPCLSDGMADWEVSFRVKNSAFYNDNKEFLDGWLKMKWGVEQKTVHEFPFSRQKFEWQARKRHAKRDGRTLADLVLQFRPSGIRVKPPTYLPALVAITQTSVVGPKLRAGSHGYRKLTPIEAVRLQGIPINVYARKVVTDQAAYKQLGNAVNVGLINRVAGILLGIYDPIPIEGRQLDLIFQPSQSLVDA